MSARNVTIAAVIFLLMGCSTPSHTKRVIVSFPERWTAREQRDCVLAGDDSVSKLPHLNCDLPATDKPRSRMFTMDVKFATTPERQQYVEWTCRRTDSSLVCGN